MPRPISVSRQKLVENATRVFWLHGYEGTSMDHLVQSTGVNRGSIYAAFNGKRELFGACLEHYRDTFVAEALTPLEQVDADFRAIEAYFEFILSKMKDGRKTQIGCLFVNAMTEIGPHDDDLNTHICAHLERLAANFRKALKHTLGDEHPALDELAQYITISAQGLYSVSRSLGDIDKLHAYVQRVLHHVKADLARMKSSE